MPGASSSSVKIFYPPFDRQSLVAVLQERIGDLREALPLTRAVLFGSYAQGRHTIGSDIDLLLVYSGVHREDAYSLARRTIGLPRLEPHLYTQAEYEQVKGTLERMIQGGITLLE